MLYESPLITRNIAASIIANKLLHEGVSVMRMDEICFQITDGEHQTPSRQLFGVPSN